MVPRLFGALFGRPAVEVVDTIAPESKEAEADRAAVALDHLRSTVRRAGADLPPVLLSRLRQIDDLLRVALHTSSVEDASTEQRYLLQAMIDDYVPTPLRSYLELPASDRHPRSGPTLLLSEQLGILESTIRDLLNQIRIGEIAELSTHGRFLADKFTEPEGLTLRNPGAEA